MTSDAGIPRPGPAGEDPGRPGRPRRRYTRPQRADEPHEACKRCGGLCGIHYLTCPLLRLPREDELAGEGELPE